MLFKMIGRFKTILLGLILSFLPLETHAAENQQMVEAIKDARQEGKVVYYASADAETVKSLAGKFERKYPGIRVDMYRSTGARLLSRVLTEARAGSYLWDVVQVNVEMFSVLKEKQLIRQYEPSSAKLYRKGFVDPEGFWTSIFYLPYTVAYNTKLIRRAEVPETWEELLNPKWKGKLGMEGSRSVWSNVILEAMGEDKGEKFFRALARQDVTFRTGLSLLAQLLAAGEIPVLVFNSIPTIERLKASGAPVDWARMKSPIPASIVVGGIGRHSAHPNAAKLFYEFLVSKEGQQGFVEYGYISAHPDLKTQIMAEIQKLDIRPSRALSEAEFERGLKIFRGTLGGVSGVESP